MNAEVLERLTRMRQGKLNSENPATIAQFTNKEFLVITHGVGLEQSRRNSELNYNLATSVSTAKPVNGSSSTSVPVDLIPPNRVDIQYLAANTDKVHRGKFFLCRTITPPLKMTGMISIVDDPKGQLGVRIAIYNFPSSSGGGSSFESSLQDLPVGRILAIKNPWFKSTIDGGFALRVDNPADILFMSNSKFTSAFPELKWEGQVPSQWRSLVIKSPSSTEEWKDEGNKFFVAKKFVQAIQSYTFGLEATGNGNEVPTPTQVSLRANILANRAAAFLNLGCFNKALDDVEVALTLEPGHQKAIFRKVKTLCGLQRFSTALAFLNDTDVDASAAGAGDKTFQNILRGLPAKVSALLHQQNSGEYDLRNLVNNTGVFPEDFAEYMGPVNVKSVTGRGRGLVATEEIQPGQLIIASRAFAIVFPSEISGAGGQGHRVEMNLNFETNFINSATQRQLVQKIAEKIQMEPSLGDLVYDLYAGSKFLTSGGAAVKAGMAVDMKRIDAISTFNSFGGKAPKKIEDLTEDSYSGLWILPSYMNHSCWDCNCIWTTFGDIMFVRAFKKISPGHEILISYTSPAEPFKTRVKVLEKHGFVCNCQLCRVDRDRSDLGRQRTLILEKLGKALVTSTISSKNENFMMSLLAQLDNLEIAGLSLNPSIVPVLLHLADWHFVSRDSGRKDTWAQISQSLEPLKKCHAIASNSPLLQFAMEASIIILKTLLGELNEGDKFEEVEGEVKKWAQVMRQNMLAFRGSLSLVDVDAPNALRILQANGIEF